MRLIAGLGSEEFAKKIADNLDVSLINRDIYYFADHEIYTEIKENVRGETVFIVQHLSPEPNRKMLGLLLLADALRNASVDKCIAIIPYLAYSRQDRRTEPRTPISARVMARLMEALWIKHAVALDLHTTQIQGFFNIPVDNIYSVPLFAKYIQDHYTELPTICSPDIGGVLRSRALAKELHTDLIVLDKRRPKPGESEILHVLGDPINKHIVIYDDIIDSAGTVCNAAKKIMELGAKSVSICATHGLFSGKALENIMQAPILKIITTDSVPSSAEILACLKIQRVSVAETMGEAITRITNRKSLTNWTRLSS